MNESYPVRCSASPPERIRVTRADDFTDDHGGDYECCSPQYCWIVALGLLLRFLVSTTIASEIKIILCFFRYIGTI